MIDDAIATESSSLGASMLQQISVRSMALALFAPWLTVHQVLRHILLRYPDKNKMLQEFKPRDNILRIDFATFMKNEQPVR